MAGQTAGRSTLVMHHLEHLVRPSLTEQWSVEQTAAIAAAEAIAMAAAADVAVEAAATAQAAVDVAAAAALKAAHRAQEVAAAARAAAGAAPIQRPTSAGAGEGLRVDRTSAAAAGVHPCSMDGEGLPPAGEAASQAAATVARRVETVAAAAAVAVVEAASVIGRQLASDVADAAEAVATAALVVTEPSEQENAPPEVADAVTFRDVAPAVGRAERTPPSASTFRAPLQTERPIFVADADPSCRLLIAESLSAFGLGNPCLEFSDGSSVIRAMQQGLDAGAARLPALVLLDAELTGTSGADVLEWMASTEGLADTPVIMLSAHADAVEVNRAYRLGARSYLVKPVGFSALGAVARDLGLAWMLV